jgi:hypothetical protein
MTSTTFSTRSPRRVRRAGAIVSGVALALSAVLAFGSAPASAASGHGQPGAQAISTQAVSGTGTVRIQFQTHWVPGLPHVRSIRIQSKNVAGKPISNCYSMGSYRPEADIWPYIQVDLPEGTYEETSYDGPVCDVAFQTAGGYGPFDTRRGHNWTVSYRDAPRLQA